MIETFKVTIWYTAPTALRMLMSAGDDVVEKYDLIITFNFICW